MSHEERWTEVISELEDFFAKTQLPSGPLQLDEATTIMDVPQFVSSHLSSAKAQMGNRHFTSYITRLIELKKILE